MRRGTRVCQAYRNAVTQLTLSCCNTIKYESPGSRRWDASSSGVKCHLHGEEGGVALSISHSPKQRTPGESSCICGVKEKKKESRAGFDQCAAVWSGLSLGAQASQPASPSAARPSLRRLRAANEKTLHAGILIALRRFKAWMRSEPVACA